MSIEMTPIGSCAKVFETSLENKDIYAPLIHLAKEVFERKRPLDSIGIKFHQIVEDSSREKRVVEFQKKVLSILPSFIRALKRISSRASLLREQNRLYYCYIRYESDLKMSVEHFANRFKKDLAEIKDEAVIQAAEILFWIDFLYQRQGESIFAEKVFSYLKKEVSEIQRVFTFFKNCSSLRHPVRAAPEPFSKEMKNAPKSRL